MIFRLAKGFALICWFLLWSHWGLAYTDFVEEPIEASSFVSPHVPGNVNDDNTSTRWEAAGAPHDLTLSLDQLMDLSEARIFWGNGKKRSYTFELISVASDGTQEIVYQGTSAKVNGYQTYSLSSPSQPSDKFIVKVLSNSTGAPQRINEIDLEGNPAPEPPPSAELLSQVLQTATADDGNVPANVDDDSLATRWSAEGDGQTIQLDFANRSTIERVELAIYLGDGQVNTFDFVGLKDDGSLVDLALNVNSQSTESLQSFVIGSSEEVVALRLIGYGNTRNDWNSFTEIDVYGSDIGVARTLALGIDGGQNPPPSAELLSQVLQTATADDGNIPENVDDDNFSTRWSAEGDGQTIQLDFANRSTIESIDLAIYLGDGQVNTFDFVGVKDDGSLVNLALGVNSQSTESLQSFAIGSSEEVVALRLVGHGNTLNDWNSFTEIDVHGSDSGIARTLALGIDGGQTPPPPPPGGSGSVPDTQVSWESDFTSLPRDAQGWTQLSPSSDSRLIYVSQSSGNDGSAQVYSPSQVGSDPHNPSGSIQAYKTVAAAVAQLREGKPDWVLLKRGDTWSNPGTISPPRGRNATERTVLTYYGSATARPLLKTGKSRGIGGIKDHLAVMGLHFYADQRDPNSPSFVGFGSVGAAVGFEAIPGSSNPIVESVLIEDCYFHFFRSNTAQGNLDNGWLVKDFVVRRSTIADNYSNSGQHSHGIFMKDASVTIEENLFDHNGWYTKTQGPPSIFEHNMYANRVNQSIFRKNIIARAASLGIKFRSDYGVFAQDVLVEKNLILEGEVGLSIGGNLGEGASYRFDNFLVVNNVLQFIGRAEPTDRGLGWGIEVKDWESGLIRGNIFSHWGDTVNIKNTYGLQLGTKLKNLEVSENIFFNIVANTSANKPKGSVDMTPSSVSSVSFMNNDVQTTVSSPEYLVKASSLATNQVQFGGNRYYSATQSQPFNRNSTALNFQGWLAQVADPGSVEQMVSYPAPQRTIETYAQQELGLSADIGSFMVEAKKQSKFNWRSEYTTEAITDHIRAGFAD